jgi:hypothetical protein
MMVQLTAVAKTNEEGLGEHHLPVLAGETGHHESEWDEKGADCYQGAEVALVVDGSGEHSDKEQQEGLCGTNPGDVGRRLLPVWVVLVICLKNLGWVVVFSRGVPCEVGVSLGKPYEMITYAKCIDCSPAVEEQEE